MFEQVPKHLMVAGTRSVRLQSSTKPTFPHVENAASKAAIAPVVLLTPDDVDAQLIWDVWDGMEPQRPSELVALTHRVNQKLAAQIPERRAIVDQLDGQLREVDQRIEHLYRLVETATPDHAHDLLDRVQVLKQRREDLEQERREATARVTPPLVRTMDERVVADRLNALLVGLEAGEQLRRLLVSLQHEHGLEVRVLDENTVRVSLEMDPGKLQAQSGQLKLVAEDAPTLPICKEVQVSPRRQTTAEWVAEQQGQHLCDCGCGGAIDVKAHHRAPSKGIPKFLKNHHKMNMATFVEQLNAEGFLTVSQAAKELGIGETTLRRMEERGLVTPLRRAWGNRPPMRVYGADSLQGLAKLQSI